MIVRLASVMVTGIWFGYNLDTGLCTLRFFCRIGGLFAFGSFLYFFLVFLSARFLRFAVR